MHQQCRFCGGVGYYEPQSGQLLAASFMDYVMPRADTLPINPSWEGTQRE